MKRTTFLPRALASAAALTFVIFALLCLGGSSAQVRADYPKPSPYPRSWELDFSYDTPRRIVVQVPGSSIPQPYWYMTYTVTNNTDREQMFLPIFELLTKDGQVIRSDRNIPAAVFQAIKQREKKPFLEPYPAISGELRLGEDQARDSVAIWPEPHAEMGQFSIFVGGLSGEILALTDSSGQPVRSSDGKPVILRKTLQLNFLIRGDEVYPGEDEVNENAREWVMR
ncbi:MAG TPA: hypothetical protein VNL70_09720 [Tepidisphaeraceae bacterium]|nr:hypothetical protein [Tepidisphaeraceae bacterium]